MRIITPGTRIPTNRQGFAPRRVNVIKSKVRSGVEHVFAVHKDKMHLFIRIIQMEHRRNEDRLD